MSVAAEPRLAAPYRGLSPFGESDLDALLFFGRERETEIATANLIASRLTVLYGPSGVGKTSLLRAGVARRVRELGGLRAVGRGPDLACVVFSSWAGDPGRSLAQAIEAEVAPLVSPIAPRPPAGVSLADLVEHWTVVLDGDLCLVLDQLEEYFVYHDAHELVEELAAVVLRPDLRANVLLSLRDDSLADLDVFKARIPTVFANSLRLDRLDRQAATAAIIGPAQQWNVLAPPNERVDIESELVDDVLAQSAVAGDATRIEAPYLQLVMERVWNEEHARGSRLLRASTLVALGGAAAIVRDHLDRALGGLDEDAQDAAALMFEHLVTPSGTKIAHRASDLAKFARLPAARAAPVLGALGRERILRPLDDTDTGGERYEIFHDVLAQAILEWSRRRELEHERIVARRRQRRLARAVVLALAALVIMGGVTTYALGQRREARQQAELASAQKAVAEKQKAVAEKQKAVAEKQTRVARTQRAIAEARRADAQRQKKKAFALAGVAQSERKKADAETQHALEEQQKAETQEQRANDEAASATAAQADAKHQADLAAAAADTATEQRKEAVAQRRNAEQAGDDARRFAEQAKAGKASAVKAEAAALDAKEKAVAAAKEAQATAAVYEAISVVNRDPETTVSRALSAYRDGAPNEFVTRALRLGLRGMRGTRIFDAHGAVKAAILDPTGQRVLTAGTSGVRIFDVRSAKTIRSLASAPATRTLTPARATTAALTPDGSIAAAGFENGTVTWWDTAGIALHTVKHGGAVTSVSISPDKRLIVTAARDNSFAIWDAATGILVKQVPLGGLVRSAMFSHDGTRILVVAALAQGARLYDTDGAFLRGFAQIGEQIRAAALSPDGARLATGGQGGGVVLFNAGTGTRLKTFVGHGGPVSSVVFSPDGSEFATTSYDNTTRTWDVSSLEPRFTFAGHVTAVLSAAYNSDGTRLVTAATDRTARIWSTANGGLESVLLGHTESVNGAAFSSDGKRVVTAGDDGNARLWSTVVEPSMRQIGQHEGRAFGAAFSSDGRRLATAGHDGTLRVWDPVRRVQVASFESGGIPLTDAAISADGRYVAGAGADGTVRIWPVAGGAPTVLRVGSAPLRSVAFSPDGTRVVVTGGGDWTATVWRWARGTRMTIPPASPGLGRCIEAGDVRGSCDAVFSPDGATIATGDVDGFVRLWRAADGTLVRRLEGHDPGPAAPTLGVTGVSFSPDGTQLVSSSRDKDARLWDLASGATVRTFRGHTAIVSGAGFNDDGRWVVTAGPSKAGIWDTRGTDLAADRLWFLIGRADQLTSAAFAPKSQTIATTSFDGSVQIYDCVLCGGLDRLVPEARVRLRALDLGSK